MSEFTSRVLKIFAILLIAVIALSVLGFFVHVLFKIAGLVLVLGLIAIIAAAIMNLVDDISGKHKD